MVKISEVPTANGNKVVKLEGQVVGPSVTEVETYCHRFLEKEGSLILDVGEVLYLDRSGVNLFKDLLERQVKLINCNAFLTELLKSAAE
jgi:hypothetical protein